MPAKIHGRLGAAALAATTDTAVYVVPAGRKATATLNLCNRSATDATVRVAMIDGAIGTLANEDYLAFDIPLPGNGQYQLDRLTLTATHTLMVRASTANVSAVAFGVEEDV